MIRPTFAARAVAGFAALALGACSGGSASTTGGSASTTGGSAEPETLADFFGGATQSPEEMEANFAEEQRRIQDLVAACMAEAGFEYIPFVPPTPNFAGFDDFDPEESARTNGFGITSQLDEPMGVTAGTAVGEPVVDPNQERVAAMGESEMQAYSEALYGPPDAGEPQVDPETGETFYVVEGFGGGCMGEAQEEVFGSQQPPPELQDEMSAMFESMRNDPRIVGAIAGWSSCMADRGYDFATPEDLYTEGVSELQGRFDALVPLGWHDPFADIPPEEQERFFAERTPEEIEAYVAEARRRARDSIDEEAVAALRSEEIDLAVANYECGLDLEEAYREVSAEYEAEFVRTHRDELEALRDERG